MYVRMFSFFKLTLVSSGSGDSRLSGVFQMSLSPAFQFLLGDPTFPSQMGYIIPFSTLWSYYGVSSQSDLLENLQREAVKRRRTRMLNPPQVALLG